MISKWCEGEAQATASSYDCNISATFQPGCFADHKHDICDAQYVRMKEKNLIPGYKYEINP